MIPKNIFQTYSDQKDLPITIKENIKNLINLNPGWTYYFFNNGECLEFIDKTYGTEIRNLYERINPAYGAARADLFRYLLIYAYGGIYLDIKAGAQKPFDEVLLSDDAYILSQWINDSGPYLGWGLWPELKKISGGEFINWVLIAEPQHPFLKNVIEYVFKRIDSYSPLRDGVGKMAVLRTTGPIPYSLAINEIREKYPHRMVNYQNLGLSYSILENSGDIFAHTRMQNINHYSLQRSPLISLPEPSEGVGEKRWTTLRRNDICTCGSQRKYKECHGRLK